ncbi:MAG: hypothetical protein FWD57_09505 [Polyangiaceae bacterium]|nr:hypothetical protein [Polyangiaceae bacterium]
MLMFVLIDPLGFPDCTIIMMCSGFGANAGCGDGSSDGRGGFQTRPHARDASHAPGWPGGNHKPKAERGLTGMKQASARFISSLGRFRQRPPDYHVSCDAGGIFYGGNWYETALRNGLVAPLNKRTYLPIPKDAAGLPRDASLRDAGKGDGIFYRAMHPYGMLRVCRKSSAILHAGMK